MDLLTNPSNRNTDTIARGGQGSGTGMPLTSPRRSYEKESTENGLTNLDNLHGPTLGPGSAGASPSGPAGVDVPLTSPLRRRREGFFELSPSLAPGAADASGCDPLGDALEVGDVVRVFGLGRRRREAERREGARWCLDVCRMV